ncbi:hypothetical protein MRB53_041262 [Persea americana]|nr:hypothetical protein MRB53_041262 [Persea americana]
MGCLQQVGQGILERRLRLLRRFKPCLPGLFDGSIYAGFEKPQRHREGESASGCLNARFRRLQATSLGKRHRISMAGDTFWKGRRMGNVEHVGIVA